MTEPARIRELAQRSQNFGYLLPYEPLLVAYGAGAEAYVYTDPNGALIKCRQFVESLAQELLARLGRSSQRKLAVDIAALDDAGRPGAACSRRLRSGPRSRQQGH